MSCGRTAVRAISSMARQCRRMAFHAIRRYSLAVRMVCISFREVRLRQWARQCGGSEKERLERTSLTGLFRGFFRGAKS